MRAQNEQDEPEAQRRLQNDDRPEFERDCCGKDQPVDRRAAQGECPFEGARQIAARVRKDDGKTIPKGGSKQRGENNDAPKGKSERKAPIATDRARFSASDE